MTLDMRWWQPIFGTTSRVISLSANLVRRFLATFHTSKARPLSYFPQTPRWLMVGCTADMHANTDTHTFTRAHRT